MSENDLKVQPTAAEVEAAKERLTCVVQGDALRDVYPRGTQPSDFHADIRTLFSALGSDSEDNESAIQRAYIAGYLEAEESRDSYERVRARAEGFANHYVNARRRAALSTPGDANGQ